MNWTTFIFGVTNKLNRRKIVRSFLVCAIAIHVSILERDLCSEKHIYKWRRLCTEMNHFLGYQKTICLWWCRDVFRIQHAGCSWFRHASGMSESFPQLSEAKPLFLVHNLALKCCTSILRYLPAAWKKSAFGWRDDDERLNIQRNFCVVISSRCGIVRIEIVATHPIWMFIYVWRLFA